MSYMHGSIYEFHLHCVRAAISEVLFIIIVQPCYCYVVTAHILLHSIARVSAS